MAARDGHGGIGGVATKVDWRRALREALRRPQDIPEALSPAPLRDLDQVCSTYPMLVPRGYLALALGHGRDGAAGGALGASDPDPAGQALLRMVLPDPVELREDSCGLEDPLAEEEHSPVFGLVHRYRDRALLLVTTLCASYCRFCTRKRLAGRGWAMLSEEQLDDVCGYLKAHPEVREVLLSGGDPLVLPDEVLDRVLARLRAVPSVKVLRLGTRVPAVLPERIDSSLAEMLARHGPLYVVTHFNHPRELDGKAREALALLADAGLPLANQTVLLAGVNDDLETLTELCARLEENRVRPYYLHLMDRTQGTGHFRVGLERALELAQGLRRNLGGLAVPLLMVDLPGGGGKVPLAADYVEGRHESGAWLVRDAEGKLHRLSDCGEG